MKITKLGHSCLLIEENNTRILVDPGTFTNKDAFLQNIDLILITHGHSDHLDVKLVKEILQNNQAYIFTNQEAADILIKEAVGSQILMAGDVKQIKDLKIEAFGDIHEPVYPTEDAGTNLSFLINDKFFIQGDAYNLPEKEISAMSLAVVGPWVKTDIAIDYALELKPKTVIPVHDGNITTPGGFYAMPEKILTANEIKFQPLEILKEYEL